MADPQFQLTYDAEKLLLKRLEEVKQKLSEQRRVGGPEYTTNQLLIGRTEGNIGMLQWVLRQAGIEA